MGQEGALLDGRYRLEEVIGEGATAGVWRAFDRLLDRPVAVKLLRPQYLGDEAILERFRREARLASLVSHPNVASTYDYAVDGDAAYIVMQLVEGPDLDAVLRRHGRLTVDHALRIAAAVADGLQAAHDIGLVHRDIKPGNILLDADGEVRVVDFGIARALSESRTTHQNALMASIRYCSPEQVTGEQVGAASDIYSLGLVLHELLTGLAPFPGTSQVSIALARIRSRPPPPSALAPDISADLDEVVMRALAPDPRHRYASAREFAEAIRQWWQTREVEPGPTDAVAVLGAGALTGPTTETLARKPAGSVPSSGPARSRRRHKARPVARALPPPRPQVAPRHRRRRRSSALGAILPLAALVAVALVGWTLVDGRPEPTGAVLGATGTPVTSEIAAAPRESAPASLVAGGSSVPPSAASPATMIPPSVTTPPSQPAVPSPTPAPDPPTAPPTLSPAEESPERRGPAAIVALWYALVEDHRFAAAADRWSSRMRQAYPPTAYIDGRFADTTRIRLNRAEIVALDQGSGRAVVRVDLTEYRDTEPSPRRFVGTWELVLGPEGWLLDEPRF